MLNLCRMASEQSYDAVISKIYNQAKTLDMDSLVHLINKLNKLKKEVKAKGCSSAGESKTPARLQSLKLGRIPSTVAWNVIFSQPPFQKELI